MEYYHYALALHIVSAVIWLGMIPADRILKKYIFGSNGINGERKLISAWLKLLNITGIIGMTGILISGVYMTVVHPTFNFFQADANHWLTTKQILLIVIIVITVTYIIPIGKKVRIALGSDLESNEPLAEEAQKNLALIAKMAQIIGALLIVNFLFGLFHSILMIF